MSNNNANPAENEAELKLIAQARKGDKQALESLIQTHLSGVFGLAFRYLHNEVDAQDAAQESFVKVWRNLSKFDPEKNFQSWIMTITKNTCLDMLKKRKVIPFSAFESEDGSNYFSDTIASEEPQPAELAERSDFKAILAGARETLSPAYQKVLSLYYDHGMNFREISEQLGQPLHTVKSRHRRAIISLKRLFEESEDKSNLGPERASKQF